MAIKTKVHVVVLGGNFAGLMAARYILDRCKDTVNITLIDRKPFYEKITPRR